MKIRLFLAMVLCWFSTSALAAELKVEHVTDNVYAIVGPHEQRNAKNFANNATFGFVVTNDGVVLVDCGGSYKGAAEVRKAIQSITDKPVKIVINTGGQDHRWLGNGYFKKLGAHIIASADAVEDQKARTTDEFFMLTNLMGKDALAGTEAVYADETFDDKLDLDFGGEHFELRHAGPAHTLGDSFVWMPKKSVMFTGDIVFVERMLGIGPAGDTQSWIDVFEAMAAHEPKYIVPGHGSVTDLRHATQDTYDYLVYLRSKIGAVLSNGGPIEEGIDIDQSQFSYLAVSEQIAKRNAQDVYMQMEFE